MFDENPCIVKLANSWILMNPGGPPTPNKPNVSVNYESDETTSTAKPRGFSQVTSPPGDQGASRV